MPLTDTQIESLNDAINRYCYPRVTYDFERKIQRCHADMRSLEDMVRCQLISRDVGLVKDGLSNVLYWGYASQGSGRQKKGVTGFRNEVTPDLLKKLALWPFALQQGIMQHDDLIKQFCNCVPQFRFSFATKVLMFLDPERFVVLDSQIGKINHAQKQTIFTRLRTDGNGMVRSDTRESLEINIAVYKDWCELCQRIAGQHGDDFDIDVRAVDIERGIYAMINDNLLDGDEPRERVAEIVAAFS